MMIEQIPILSENIWISWLFNVKIRQQNDVDCHDNIKSLSKVKEVFQCCLKIGGSEGLIWNNSLYERSECISCQTKIPNSSKDKLYNNCQHINHLVVKPLKKKILSITTKIKNWRIKFTWVKWKVNYLIKL